jgi:hypothetical protein
MISIATSQPAVIGSMTSKIALTGASSQDNPYPEVKHAA